jgi:putative ABC transport system permease protein
MRAPLIGVMPRLAWQNLGRRPTRTTLMITAVALGCGAVFATLSIACGIQASMSMGFSRMGADLAVVPKDTLVNLTSALLTVEPTPHTLDLALAEEVATIPGVCQVAPQRLHRLNITSSGHSHEVHLVAFDPARDFTVQPWIRSRLPRELRDGDVLIGGRCEEVLGEKVALGGHSLTVYGKLERTGVGPFDSAYFTTFSTADSLNLPLNKPAQASTLLIQLGIGARPEQVRFALARYPDIKVTAGGSLLTSVRQGLSAQVGSVAAFTALLLLGAALLVAVLFSAIVAERRREIGLLRSLGASRSQIVRLFITEAGLITGLGAAGGLILGIGLLLAFQRSLGYWFATVDVPLVWPSAETLAVIASACVIAAIVIGLGGALLPVWRTAKLEPYALMQSEGK